MKKFEMLIELRLERNLYHEQSNWVVSNAILNLMFSNANGWICQN